MPFVDDPNAEDTGSVAGPNPLQQGQVGSSMTSGQPSGDANQASAGGSSTMQSNSPQDQQSTSNRKGPASSGMFTNIQKYVNKNKPQAKKMAGAVTQDFSKQAGDIRQAAEAKQKEQAELIGANKKKLNDEEKWATGQVEQVTGINQQPAPQPEASEAPAPVQYNPSDVDAERFSKVAQGNLDDLGLTSVQDLNLAQQQNRMAALGQLAGQADTEQGRRNLLGQTFQKQGEYSRGMSGLDNLITSGDKAARESLIGGVKDQSDQLKNNLVTMAQKAGETLGEQNRRISGFGKGIKDMASSAESDIDTNIDSNYKKALAERAALLDPNSEEYKAALEGAITNLQSKKDLLNGGNYADLLESLIPQAYQNATKRGVDADDAATTNLQNYVNSLRQFQENGTITRMVPHTENTGFGPKTTYTRQVLSGDEAQNYLNSGGGINTSHFKHREAIRSLQDLANQRLGLDSDLYGTGQYTSGTSGNSLEAMRNFYNNNYSNLDAETALKNRLSQMGGSNYQDLTTGRDINKYETAGEDQVSKINGLKKLLGQTDYITDQQIGDGKYASQDDIRSLLARYGS